MPISGFPEWLPKVKLIEEWLIATITKVYQTHAFLKVETSSVEHFSTLEANGVEGKEIYLLKRAQSSDDESSNETLALHFDLTVPFSRYVCENLNNLHFPFRRYSLQKVWRGERPQRGRFREFYQFDIDTVSRETLPLACDAETISVIYKAFEALSLFKFKLKLCNRKFLLGFYRSLELRTEDEPRILVIIDKIDKIGASGVKDELLNLGLPQEKIDLILAFSAKRVSVREFPKVSKEFAVSNELYQGGCSELEQVTALIDEALHENILIDFSLVRGLSYYTGSILEVVLPDYPHFGSAGGGGRYEDLGSRFSSQKLPAVGASIGITRLMALILEENILTPVTGSVIEVLVTVNNEESRLKSNKVADKLRSSGVNCEVYFKAPRLGAQIEYAEKRGIPFVLFLKEDEGGESYELKDLKSKEIIKLPDVAAGYAHIIAKREMVG
jgi:histidyl-tRNA synthetase